MVAASLFTFALFAVWTRGVAPSAGTAIAFAAAVLVALWFASWRLSWRLVSPLNRLVDVVRRFGDGDLTARARFPAQARDEVARVANAIDTMADRLEQQVRDERQLLAVVSHELRTPLARVRVLTALAREGRQDAIDEIDREVAEIDDLVSKVLARSRLTFGTMTTREVGMGAAVREAIERAGLPADLLRVAATPDVVIADPTLLHRAVVNLLENAAQHGLGIDAVEVRSAPGEVLVEVFDRGPGFPEADASSRFAAYAPDHGGGRGSGLGLGLHLVSRIVTAHRGRVWAENQSGGGARVGFALPAAPPS
jgi:signal transduction histidine kinase